MESSGPPSRESKRASAGRGRRSSGLGCSESSVGHRDRAAEVFGLALIEPTCRSGGAEAHSRGRAGETTPEYGRTVVNGQPVVLRRVPLVLARELDQSPRLGLTRT